MIPVVIVVVGIERKGVAPSAFSPRYQDVNGNNQMSHRSAPGDDGMTVQRTTSHACTPEDLEYGQSNETNDKGSP